MKKIVTLFVGVAMVILMAGCEKKTHQQPTEEVMAVQENTADVANQEMNAQTNEAVEAGVSVAPEAAQVAQPAVPPGTIGTPKEIQTALKNAGLYTGKIDGTIGPKTKIAIKNFQQQNGLTADGKVGPKTWVKLSTYLTATATTAAPATEQAAQPAY